MELTEKKCRDIFIIDDITYNTTSSVIKEILQINHDDNICEHQDENYIREPIRIYIHSYGGDVSSGFAIADIIHTSKTPVHTIAIGMCASIALIVFIMGTERYIGINSALMFHGLNLAVDGKLNEIRTHANNTGHLQNTYIDMIVSRSLVTRDLLFSYINRKDDWFIYANEAIPLKLADKYYD